MHWEPSAADWRRPMRVSSRCDVEMRIEKTIGKPNPCSKEYRRSVIWEILLKSA